MLACPYYYSLYCICICILYSLHRIRSLPIVSKTIHIPSCLKYNIKAKNYISHVIVSFFSKERYVCNRGHTESSVRVAMTEKLETDCWAWYRSSVLQTKLLKRRRNSHSALSDVIARTGWTDWWMDQVTLECNGVQLIWKEKIFINKI